MLPKSTTYGITAHGMPFPPAPAHTNQFTKPMLDTKTMPLADAFGMQPWFHLAPINRPQYHDGTVHTHQDLTSTILDAARCCNDTILATARHRQKGPPYPPSHLVPTADHPFQHRMHSAPQLPAHTERVCRGVPSQLQVRTVLSSLPLTMVFPSGEKATLLT